MKYKNLILVGTSHIAKQSLKDVENAIEKHNPKIIAIELDKRRFYAMTHKVKKKVGLRDIRRIGFKGFLFNIFGAWAEEKLGNLVGMKPGAEMMNAIRIAKKRKNKIALIDQDIEITMRRISQTLTWKEKWRFFVDILKGLIFRKSEMKKYEVENLDLTKVPPKKLIKKLTKQVKKRYPNLYKVLIGERNEIMAARLKKLMLENTEANIVAVVGAGHEDEIIDLIKGPKISYSLTIG